MLNEEINKIKRTLDDSICDNEHIQEIYKISEELDKYIVDYYKINKK